MYNRIAGYKQYYKSLVMLGVPIIIGQLGAIITGLADTIMVGQHSTEELAAASFVNNVINAFIIMGTGFSYNLTPLIGQNLAMNKKIVIGGWLKNSFGLSLNIFWIKLRAFTSGASLQPVFFLFPGFFQEITAFISCNLKQPVAKAFLRLEAPKITKRLKQSLLGDIHSFFSVSGHSKTQMEKRLPVRPDQLFKSRAVSSQGFVQQLLFSFIHLIIYTTQPREMLRKTDF